MKYNIGDFYNIKTKTMNNFKSIFLGKKNGKFIFQKIGCDEFNGKMYCDAEEIISVEIIDRNRLILYLNSQDKILIQEIFNSLYKIK